MKAELPELELVKRDLEREIAGRKIKDVAAAGMSVLPRYKNRKAFASQLDGVKINAVIRQGHHLIFPLDSDDILVIRAGDGQFRRNANKDKDHHSFARRGHDVPTQLWHHGRKCLGTARRCRRDRS